MATNSNELQKIFTKNLNNLLLKHNKQQKEVAEKIGVVPSTFNAWCKGKSMPRMGKIQALAEYFKVNNSDLLSDKTEPDIIEKIGGIPYNPTHRIPILGYISAGLPLYAEEHIEGYTFTDLNGYNEYFALRVKGDSMNAVNICPGSIVIVRRQPVVENGEIAVIMVDGENATVKRFYRNGNGNTVTLMPQSNNPQHLPQIYNLEEIEIKIIGKVVRSEITFE